MSTATPYGRHELPEEAPEPQSFGAEFRDAVSLRTVVLILGVLLLQLGFVLSYVGAFHAPTPQHIPLGVASPSTQASGRVVAKINSIPSAPLAAVPVADRATAEQQIRSGALSAALIVDPQGTADTLLVSSGGGVSVASAVTTVLTEAQAAQHRTVAVQDIVPLQPGDGRGLTGFYLVIGWVGGGHLVGGPVGV